jgi:hypothetical protein
MRAIPLAAEATRYLIEISLETGISHALYPKTYEVGHNDGSRTDTRSDLLPPETLSSAFSMALMTASSSALDSILLVNGKRLFEVDQGWLLVEQQQH